LAICRRRLATGETIEETFGTCENKAFFKLLTDHEMEEDMQSRYIMTAFGKDRPGIVADVTEVLYENDCNLEDTSMSMLSDEFTINLLFSSNNDNIEATLLEKCNNLEQQKNISAFIRPLKERSQISQEEFSTCTLHVEGMDQAGIVFKISQFLSNNSFNIVDLKSTVKVTPESGTALYLMDIHIQVPESTSTKTFGEGLNLVAEELNVEITVTY
jgi:glycine cleavage system transcriptional repressor